MEIQVSVLYDEDIMVKILRNRVIAIHILIVVKYE